MLLLKSLAVLVAVVLYAQLPTPTEGQVNCQSTFLTRFLQCVSNSTLNPQHFLWLTRDGNMGSQPPDLPAFTQSACMKEQELGNCFKNVVAEFDNTTSGCSESDKNAIKQFYKNVAINLDKKCFHPCRDELVPSLADCFTSANVSATLFLSNVTLMRNQMLGETDDDVDMFCTKQVEILECMKTKTEMCPETPDILMSAGIDVDAMNNTVALLCDNRQLYLHGVRCSANRSMEEEQCHETLLQQLSELEVQFEAMNIERDVFAVDICRLRLDHIRCDLNSLSRRDDDTKCPDEVVGLRREQECTLVPAACESRFQDRVMDMCDPMRFLKEKRKSFITAQRLKSAAGKNAMGYGLSMVIVLSGSFLIRFL